MGQDRADDERFNCVSRRKTMVEGAETLAHGRIWPRRRCDYLQRWWAHGLLNLQSRRDHRAGETYMNDLAELAKPVAEGNSSPLSWNIDTTPVMCLQRRASAGIRWPCYRKQTAFLSWRVRCPIRDIRVIRGQENKRIDDSSKSRLHLRHEI